jgi:hypothetical protein
MKTKKKKQKNKKNEIQQKWWFKEAAVPLELPVGHLDHHLQCPTVQVAM